MAAFVAGPLLVSLNPAHTFIHSPLLSSHQLSRMYHLYPARKLTDAEVTHFSSQLRFARGSILFYNQLKSNSEPPSCHYWASLPHTLPGGCQVSGFFCSDKASENHLQSSADGPSWWLLGHPPIIPGCLVLLGPMALMLPCQTWDKESFGHTGSHRTDGVASSGYFRLLKSCPKLIHLWSFPNLLSVSLLSSYSNRNFPLHSPLEDNQHKLL